MPFGWEPDHHHARLQHQQERRQPGGWGELDKELAGFRYGRLDKAAYRHVWLDATYHKLREGGRIVGQATVIAVGVRETGEKSVLGLITASTRGRASGWSLPQPDLPAAQGGTADGHRTS